MSAKKEAKTSRARSTSQGQLLSDRTVKRLTIAFAALIVIGLPAIAITYYLDRHVEGGGSIPGRAVAAAEAAVRADPNLISARLSLASAYALNNRQADAVEQYDIVLQAQTNNKFALLGRGEARRALGDLDAAAADYQSVVDIAKDEEFAAADPQLESAYFGLGAVAMAQQRPRDAATHLANALLIDSTDADALDLLGQALTAIGDSQNAISALRDAVRLVPSGWCDPYEHLAQAYDQASDADGSTYAKGMVALCEKRFDDAEALLSPLTEGAHGRDVLIGLGLLAEDRGDTTTAAEMYGRVASADPNDFDAVTGLGRVGAPMPGTTQPPASSPASDGGN
jgi:tetratricopeptide (TPR) repeat protein